jgi:uncharacterized protein (TIGR02145 family)
LFLVPCFIHAQVPSYVPTSGLVGYWPFNGNANDESGNGNNGTANGATLTTDRFGVVNKAYNLDGNDWIEVASNVNQNIGLGSFSLSCWVLKSGTNSFDHLITRNIGTTNQNFISSYTLRYQSNSILFAGSSSSALNLNNSGCVSNAVNNLSNWNYVVGVFDSASVSFKIYFNGNLISNCAVSQVQSLINNNGNIYFGVENPYANLASGPLFLNGKLDDIAIYNRALTQQEISNLYTNSGPPSISTSASSSLINCGESSTLTASSTSTSQPCIKVDLPATLQNGLVGYWPFCGNANDASGNGNNGTVNGATLTTDRFGNVGSAYSLDGVNDYISVSNSLFTQGPFSFSGWVYCNNNSYFNPIVGFGELGGQNTNRLYIASPFAQIGTEGMNDISSATSFSVSLGWHHWTIVLNSYNVNAVSFYCDGQLLSGNTTNGANIPFPLNNVGFTFGRHTGASNTTYANAILDDIAIYNRALTATEIQQLYNLGNVTYSWSTGATTPSITVTPAQTTSYTCTATNASGSTTSSVSVTVADTLTWTGAVDTDWHKPCNWSPQFVPKCCNNVSVPLTSNQPIVSGVAAAEDLSIFTTNGAQLTVNNGANLQIADCPSTITTTACPSLAVISTSAVTSITQTTAVSGGTISYQGASAITARGVCWSTSPNPTIANSTTSNGTGIGTFTSNLTGLVAGTTYYARAYATNGSGTSYGNQVSFVAVNPQPAYPANSVFCASGPTLVVDVTSPTGKTWMDRNLGATQVATSSTDAAAYGDLYQWGRGSDGHQCRNSATTVTLSATNQPGHGDFILMPYGPYDWLNPSNNNLWQGVLGVNNPCPNGYRVPTITELETEQISWSSNNSNGAFLGILKITSAGYRGNEGVLNSNGTEGRYWSATTSSINTMTLNVFSNSVISAPISRATAFSVRCIKN